MTSSDLDAGLTSNDDELDDDIGAAGVINIDSIVGDHNAIDALEILPNTVGVEGNANAVIVVPPAVSTSVVIVPSSSSSSSVGIASASVGSVVVPTAVGGAAAAAGSAAAAAAAVSNGADDTTLIGAAYLHRASSAPPTLQDGNGATVRSAQDVVPPGAADASFVGAYPYYYAPTRRVVDARLAQPSSLAQWNSGWSGAGPAGIDTLDTVDAAMRSGVPKSTASPVPSSIVQQQSDAAMLLNGSAVSAYDIVVSFLLSAISQQKPVYLFVYFVVRVTTVATMLSIRHRKAQRSRTQTPIVTWS